MCLMMRADVADKDESECYEVVAVCVAPSLFRRCAGNWR